MLTPSTFETKEERPPESSGITIDETSFADAMLASYRRAVESVAAAPVAFGPPRAALLRSGVRAGGLSMWAPAPPDLLRRKTRPSFRAPSALTRAVFPLLSPAGPPSRSVSTRPRRTMPAAGEQAMAAFGDLARDAVIAVSASGSTPFTVAAAAEAHRRGALVIAIAHRAGSPLLSPQMRRSSSTAARRPCGARHDWRPYRAKAALGMALIIDGVRTRPRHQGLMVNLKADNAKLRDRARGIVVTIAGVSEVKADAALREAGGEVKTGDPDRLRRRQHERSRCNGSPRGKGGLITRCVVRRSSGSIKGRGPNNGAKHEADKGCGRSRRRRGGVVSRGSRRLRQAR